MSTVAAARVDVAFGEIVCFGADDSRLVAIVDALHRAGFTAVPCGSLQACIRALVSRPSSMCLVDVAAQPSSLSALRTLRRRFPLLPIGALSDATRPPTTAEARSAGASDVAAWPAALHDLTLLVINTRDRSTSSTEAGDGAGIDVRLIAQSPAMQHVVELVAEAARGRAGVCVSGEPGSGRSLVARTIHQLSDERGERPCVVEDCADAPHDLERRLFGIVATAPRLAGGAPTAAEPIGTSSALDRARGGTLLLRNVADAPARVQVRLARLLRDRESILVSGARAVIEMDVQPIATLDTGVDAAVSEGRLRRDLYKQLAQIRIDMPALRHRREDIAPLAHQFLSEVCGVRQTRVKSFSRSTLQVMCAMPWAGNATELRALMEELADVDGPVIHLEHLLSCVSLDGLGEPVDAGATLRDARARFERDCISAVLIRHRGRVPEAAKALGIQRTNLYRKIRQLNVARSLLSARR